ncbi:hypothetical protein KCP70_06075 [Salmonella enterica subsp. enterica]|nr:hypothetical protein KCP70_06075 [Salmonella enterica subsp. enterica]
MMASAVCSPRNDSISHNGTSLTVVNTAISFYYSGHSQNGDNWCRHRRGICIKARRQTVITAIRAR